MTALLGRSACGVALCGMALAASPAAAQSLGYHNGGLNAAVRGAVSAQTSAVSDGDRSSGAKATNVDGYIRLIGDWTAPQGWLVGASLETATRRTTQALRSGEAYVYLSSGLGRVQVGKSYGPANSLALHAPEIALGQVRGDFGRYAGSNALLSAFDTGEAAKIMYLSPPVGGFRVGASWAPKFHGFNRVSDPRNRTLQRDAVELALQYQRPVGDWVLGASGGYVHANSEASTGRRDIRSWSAGAEARRGPLRLGLGYVDRGDSNLKVRGFNQHEVNAGVAWTEARWGIAASASRSTGARYRNTLLGAGGYYNLNSHITARADLVRFDDRDGGLPRRRGEALVSEIEYHF